MNARAHVTVAVVAVGLALGCKKSASSETKPTPVLSTRPVDTQAPSVTATASAATRSTVELPAAAASSARNEAAGEDTVDPTGDACAVGYARSGAKCHRMCRRDADCHAPSTCVSLAGSRTKVCDASAK